MTKYSDSRMRTSAAGVHRAALKKQNVNLDWWYGQFINQDGICASCKFETIYLVPFPDIPPFKCIICKTCLVAWETRDTYIPQLKERLEFLEEQDAMPPVPTEAQAYLLARMNPKYKVIKPFGAPLTAEETDMFYDGTLYLNTWLGAPEEHRPSEESLRIKNK